MTWQEMILNFLSELWTKFVDYVPIMFGVLVVLVIGWIVGRVLGKSVSKVLDKIGVDDALRKTIFGKAIEKSGITVVRLFDLIVRWFVYLIAILAATDILNIEVLSNFMNRIVEYIPSLLAGFVVIIAGIILTDFFSDMTKSFVETASAEYAETIVVGLRFFLYFIVITIGLSMMKIDVTILYTFANAMAWGAALGIGAGLGIALGWGLKDTVAKKAKEMLKKE